MVQAKRNYPSDLRQLADIRGFVCGACRQALGSACDEARLCELELAVGEAAANIVLHAYHHQAGKPIELDVAVENNCAVVTMYHYGEPFDPSTVEPPVLDGTRECGYGVYLIEKSVDEVSYFREESGRVGIRLVKTLA